MNKITFALIALNEGKNLERCIKSFIDISNSIILLDSYSTDNTLDIARKYNVKILQNKFINFGDQWNYLLSNFKINTKWVFKIDPDEELTSEFRQNLIKFLNENDDKNGFYIDRQLFFLGKKLPIKQKILRIWKNGCCKFSDLKMNEYPIINGKIAYYKKNILHHDSPNIEHWINKHNQYSSLEANNIFNISVHDKNSLEYQKLKIKRLFFKFPFKYFILYLYFLIFKKMLLVGKVGLVWSKLRVEYFRTIEYKIYQLENLKKYQPYE